MSTEIEREKRALEIYKGALEIFDAQARVLYVLEKCGEDEVLRRNVEKLLRSAQEMGNFLLEEPGPYQPELCDLRENHVRPARPDDMIGKIIDRYKVLRKLGEGGMGAVFMAEEEHTQRKVAVKVIKANEQSPGARARFDLELEALAKMNHPNIATVFASGTTQEGQPYFVMELIEGSNHIPDFCDNESMTLRNRLELFKQVCAAIQHAHNRCLVHRDIKPSNVLVFNRDDTPICKVIDFGVAKLLHSNRRAITITNARIGTPQYMSPEQANAGEITIKSDIFGLGALLYELLTGTIPLPLTDNEGPKQYMNRICSETPTRPSDRLRQSNELSDKAAKRKMEPARLVEAVRGELDSIVMKALQKSPQTRYESANALAKDIDNYLTGEPVKAMSPYPRFYWLKKKGRKHWKGVLTATAFVSLLIAGIAFSSRQWLRAARNEETARAAQQEAEANAAQARLAAEAAEKNRATAETTAELARQAAAAKSEALIKMSSFVRTLNSLGMEKDKKKALSMLRHNILEILGQVDKSASLDPLTDARTRAALGNMLGELGDIEMAIKLLEHACKTLEPALGLNSSDTLDAMQALGRFYWENGQWETGRKVCKQVYDERMAQGSIEDTRTLVSLHNLALTCMETGQADLSILLLERVVKEWKEKSSISHLVLRAHLAIACHEAGKTDRAVSQLKELLDNPMVKLGINEQFTLLVKMNLASFYLEIGKPKLGLELLNQSLIKMEAGTASALSIAPDLLSVLIVAYQDMNEIGKAEEKLQQWLKILLTKYAGESTATARVRVSIAWCFLKQQKFAAAETHLRKCILVDEKNQKVISQQVRMSSVEEKIRRCSPSKSE